MMYSIGEVSEIVGITKHTIRYYTDLGLVPNLKRDKNNIRVFDEDSLNWLIGVTRLKNCGMSIKDIKKYNELCLLGDSTIEQRYEIILKQKEMADINLKKTKEVSEYLSNKINHYSKIVDRTIPDNTNPNKWKNEEEITTKNENTVV